MGVSFLVKKRRLYIKRKPKSSQPLLPFHQGEICGASVFCFTFKFQQDFCIFEMTEKLCCLFFAIDLHFRYKTLASFHVNSMWL